MKLRSHEEMINHIQMKNILLLITYVVLVVQSTQAQKKDLVEISQDYVSSFVQVKNANAKLTNEKSILIEMDKQNSLVELYAPNKLWDLHNNTSIFFNVSNLGIRMLPLVAIWTIINGARDCFFLNQERGV